MVLPPGALEVACNAHCSQAWAMRRTLAVQFHPEVTLDVLDLWLDNGGAAVVESQGLNLEQLRTSTLGAEDGARRRTATLVDAFLGRIATA
jgi:hypothetical protein